MRVDFGQGNLVDAFVRQRKSKDGWLDEVDRLVEWPRVEALFSDIYASREGGASYPILMVGRPAASQIASASAVSFFCRLTNGFT